MIHQPQHNQNSPWIQLSAWNIHLAGLMAMVVIGLSFTGCGIRERINQDRAETILKKGKVYQVLAQQEPATYQKILAEATDSLSKGESEEILASRLRPMVMSVLPKYFSRCSDKALVNYLQVTIKELEQVLVKNPDAAFALMFPTPENSTANLTQNIDRTILESEQEALAQVIQSGNQSETIPINRERAQENLIPIVRRLQEKHGPDTVDLLENPTAPGIDKARVCRILIDLYREILSLPQENSAEISRMMLSEAFLGE